MKFCARHNQWILFALVFGWIVLPVWAPADTDSGYQAVTGPCNFSFPRDHGAHPGYRTEWWYYTGNLEGEDGRAYGFQLTFFRSQISPSQAKKSWPIPRSAWRTQQIYLGHAAISDLSAKRHLQAEDAARHALGMAGVDQDKQTTRIYLKNWSAAITDRSHVIEVKTDLFSYQLNLRALKPPVFHGKDGYSRKGSDVQRASCYYSFTRLASR